MYFTFEIKLENHPNKESLMLEMNKILILILNLIRILILILIQIFISP